MSRSIVWIAAFCLATTLSSRAERLMVKDADVRLYQDRRISAVLPRGAVVEAQPIAGDRRYIQVTWGDETHMAEAKSFITRRGLEDLLGDRIIDANTKLETINRDMARSYEQLDSMQAAIIHAQRDTALVFRTEKRQIVVPPGANVGTVQIQVVTNRVLSTSKARRLERDIEKNIAELQTQINDLWRSRDATLRTLRSTRMERDGWLARFDGPVGDQSEWQPHVVTAETATLWLDRQTNIARPLGTTLPARPHPEAKGWLQVQMDDAIYSVRDTEIQSVADLQVARLEAFSTLEAREHLLKEEIRLYENRIGRYQMLGKELDHATRRNERIVVMADGNLQPGFVGVYVVEFPGSGATVAIDRSDARDVLKDWAKDAAAVQADLDRATLTLAEVRKDLARAQRDLRDLGIELPPAE